MQTIFPVLRYEDARAAIQSLCAMFGFIELFSVPKSGASVRHAQLKLGTNIVMLGSIRPDEGMASPRALGVATQALYVYVDDLDAHYERARRAGAQIVSPPEDTDFGSREYHVRDVEGHLWTFGTFLPTVGERD
ncbi:MAG TPA: VOC family protein [Pyrinomonadaceae bacterium]|nr:VOC family protein [Pyrinomonadaceae bacterium]